MIQVTYHTMYCRVTVRGHARSGELGQDLVCAAASALVMTLARNVASLAEGNAIREHNVRLADGEAEISCVPVRKMRSVVTLVFNAVCSGFEILQTLYPENIQYRVLG